MAAKLLVGAFGELALRDCCTLSGGDGTGAFGAALGSVRAIGATAGPGGAGNGVLERAGGDASNGALGAARGRTDGAGDDGARGSTAARGGDADDTGARGETAPGDGGASA